MVTGIVTLRTFHATARARSNASYFTMMLRPFKTLRGFTLAASDGEIGTVREFYFDDEQWKLRYFIVETGSWLTGRPVLIAPSAIGEVDAQSGVVSVNLTREQVREAPPIDSEQTVSRQREAELHSYYGWDPYWNLTGGTPGMMMPPAVAPAAFVPDAAKSEQTSAEAREAESHLRSSAELMAGYTIHAQDGEIGQVADFILDDRDWSVRYLVIHTGVWFLGKDVLLAPEWVEGISYQTSEVFVNLPRSAIKDAPGYDANAPLDRAFEERLHDHYGRKGYWDAVQAAREP